MVVHSPGLAHVAASYSTRNNSFSSRLWNVALGRAGSSDPSGASLEPPPYLTAHTLQMAASYRLAQLVNPSSNSCLMVSLLAVSLFTSVLTTVLLSFVIHSLQLNDKGLLQGNLVWEEKLGTNALKLPTTLSDKSISLDSIQSSPGRPLQFKNRWSSSLLGARRANSTTTNRLIIVSYPDNNNCIVKKRPDDGGCTFNYFALVNVNTSKTNSNQLQPPMLEIRAKSLTIDLLTADNSSKRSIGSHGANNKSLPPLPNGLKSNTHDAYRDSTASFLKHTSDPIRLFEMDGQSITLDQETQLNSSSFTSGSLIVNGRVRSSQMTGSLNDNLDVQTRNGDLQCQSDQEMELVSKSAHIKLSSNLNLKFNAPKVEFDSSHIYVRSGLDYYDGKALEQDQNSGNQVLDSPVAAYSLITVNGLIMASQSQ